ncbi:MAG: amino acid ABC transporter permease, partial [Verrucomicrobiota bacterium]
LKDSSLVSMITLLELTGAYQRLAPQHYDYFLLGAVVAGFYLLLGLPFVRLARRLEARLDRAR